jgi:hypothetical protein
MRRLPFGLMNSGAMKDKPINFTSLGIGAHSRALRRRVSRDVFTVNQGLVTPDISTNIVSPVLLKVNENNINNTENTFTVELNSKPVALATVEMSVADSTEAITIPERLYFSDKNWNIPQTVTVKGINDNLFDKTINTSVSVSVLTGNDIKTLPIEVSDSEIQEVIVTGITNSTIVGDEGSVTTQTIGMKLKYETTENMTYNIVSNNGLVTLDKSQVVYTPENWDEEQELVLTINKPDDGVADGDISVEVSLTNVENSTSIAPIKIIYVVIRDDESLAANISHTDNFFYEDGSVIIDVTLNAEPVNDVSLSVVPTQSSRVSSITPLTFTTTDWDTPQQITLSGVNNGIFNSPETVDLSFSFTSGGGGANNVSYDYQEKRTFTMYDASQAIFVESNSLTITEGSQESFDISLSTRPVGNNTLTFSAGSHIGSIASIIFDATNWSNIQTIAIPTIASDYAVNQNDTLVISSDVAGFDDVSIPVTITNTTIADMTLSVSDISVNEAGQATFEVSLTSKPVNAVTLDLTLNNTTNFSIDESQLVFNADTPIGTTEIVTLTGIEDADGTGNIDSTIDIVVNGSSSSEYTGVSSKTINITMVDNDDPVA